MLNRIVLSAVALATSIAACAAGDQPKQRQCPTLDHREIESLLRKTRSCQRAVALFEICQTGSSGDVSFARSSPKNAKATFCASLVPRRGGV
jgi:hypothetical protein